MSEHVVPRSTEAAGLAEVAAVVHARRAKPNGWWGMALLVATEATLFGTLVGTYFYLRFRATHWPPPGVPAPELLAPLVLTGVLVATSVPMQAAYASARRGRVRLAWLLLAAALLVQAGYLAMQIRLFQDDLLKVDPTASAYGSIYFTLLGAHHTHVAVGLALDLWLLLRLLRGVTTYRLVGLRATALYWHFVNVLALVVVGTQLSAAV